MSIMEEPWADPHKLAEERTEVERLQAQLTEEITKLRERCEAYKGQVKAGAAEIERLRLFLGDIAAMGPADAEWGADTLDGAVTLAKRALGRVEQRGDGK